MASLQKLFESMEEGSQLNQDLKCEVATGEDYISNHKATGVIPSRQRSTNPHSLALSNAPQTDAKLSSKVRESSKSGLSDANPVTNSQNEMQLVARFTISKKRSQRSTNQASLLELNRVTSELKQKGVEYSCQLQPSVLKDQICLPQTAQDSGDGKPANPSSFRRGNTVQAGNAPRLGGNLRAAK